MKGRKGRKEMGDPSNDTFSPKTLHLRVRRHFKLLVSIKNGLTWSDVARCLLHATLPLRKVEGLTRSDLRPPASYPSSHAGKVLPRTQFPPTRWLGFSWNATPPVPTPQCQRASCKKTGQKKTQKRACARAGSLFGHFGHERKSDADQHRCFKIEILTSSGGEGGGGSTPRAPGGRVRKIQGEPEPA